MGSRRAARATSSKTDADDCPKLPPEHLLPFGEVMLADRWQLECAKLREIQGLLFVPKPTTEAETNARLVRALELYESLMPRDSAEGMLAEQMVGTHFAALECLRRAALDGQTFEGRDTALKHATRLMKLYAEQLAALGKHRGKGQQKVTVEHVHVHPGGQAIVGAVDSGGSGAARPASPAALNSAPDPQVRLDEPVPVTRRGHGAAE